jgi:hypothetical protein
MRAKETERRAMWLSLSCFTQEIVTGGVTGSPDRHRDVSPTHGKLSSNAGLFCAWNLRGSV